MTQEELAALAVVFNKMPGLYAELRTATAQNEADGQRIAELEAENERLTARVAELEAVLKRCAEIVERNNHRQNEKVDDVKLIARRTLALVGGVSS